jgi:hypothetical protein
MADIYHMLEGFDPSHFPLERRPAHPLRFQETGIDAPGPVALASHSVFAWKVEVTLDRWSRVIEASNFTASEQNCEGGQLAE